MVRPRFRITRSGSDQLLVEVFENGSGDDFGFVVTLASGTRTRDITVTQGRSDGYVFERIEYVPVAESSARVWREGGRFPFRTIRGGYRVL